MRKQTISVVIAQPFDEVYGFLADPLNFPSWGPVTDPEIHHLHGSDWLMHLQRGPRVVRFTEPNLYGVLDFVVFGAGEPPGLPVPARLVRVEEGSELTLTWRQRHGSTDEEFEAGVDKIERHFARLKAMLEADPAS